MAKLGKPLVLPEEIVHYSEWFHALRHEIAAKQVRDVSGIVVTVHPACHYYKIVEGDAIYDPDIYGGQRTAVVTGLAEALGAEVRNYSTWFDCCGFGFRHILVQRDFTRSFATLRKIEVMKEEANPTSCSPTTPGASRPSTRASSRPGRTGATSGWRC